MSRNRFVTPDTVRLPLSDGDFIEVKRRLTNGERRFLNSAALGKKMPLGAEVTEIAVDFAEMGTARALTYIVDWSFEDDGHRVPFTREAFLSLDEETAAEIDAALDAHIETQAGNSLTASVNGSEPASPSVSGSAGDGTAGQIYQIT